MTLLIKPLNTRLDKDLNTSVDMDDLTNNDKLVHYLGTIREMIPLEGRVSVQWRIHTWNLCLLSPLSGWSVPYEPPTSASSSTLCALAAFRGASPSPEPHTPPQEGAWGASPRTETATAAEHLPEITGLETTQTTNVITATITKIKNRTETKKGTDTETTNTGDAGKTDRTETKTDTD